MTTKEQVLTILLRHHGEWQSGDQLAQSVGCSRESIWKAINALRKQGHQIESRKNRGYCYLGSRNLDAKAIQIYGQRQFTGPLEVVAQTPSTQILAKSFLSHHQPQFAAFFADEQTAGYGRLGRDFYSPAKTGLYFSLVVPNPTNALANVGLLTTGVAVSVLNVLQQFYPNKNFGLKWVNDIYLDQYKVGGIITEASLELESTSAAAFIVGVGLNLTTTDFPRELQARAQAVDPSMSVDRNRLAAALLSALVALSKRYATADFLPAYRAKSLVLGQQVTLQVGDSVVNGVAEDIDEHGGLVVRMLTGERRTFTSGEVIRVGLPV